MSIVWSVTIVVASLTLSNGPTVIIFPSSRCLRTVADPASQTLWDFNSRRRTMSKNLILTAVTISHLQPVYFHGICDHHFVANPWSSSIFTGVSQPNFTWLVRLFPYYWRLGLIMGPRFCNISRGCMFFFSHFRQRPFPYKSCSNSHSHIYFIDGI